MVVDDELRISISPDFDLVLIELMMRDNTGFTRLDHVCVNCPDIPVVMLRDVSVALPAIRPGAYGYVLKPFAHEQFLDGSALPSGGG